VTVLHDELSGGWDKASGGSLWPCCYYPPVTAGQGEFRVPAREEARLLALVEAA
jgi:hypothetical protein